ncbi:MAG: polyphosphate kinase 1 [Spirochaetaceae bacterium]|jgi:polyphosphate kinase|nr:polyphosphate kinase 1 [Spirochaetaceae bacterium]
MKYLDRELSALDFNQRVLEEGLRPDLPPLERFHFLSIVSSNLDEFYMVRFPSILANSGNKELLSAVRAKTASIIKREYDCLQNEILPDLKAKGLFLSRPDSWNAGDLDFLEEYFFREVYPVLTPLRIENSENSVSVLGGLFLYAAFLVDDTDAGGEELHVVQIPKILKRLIAFPQAGKYALLDDIILTWGAYLFPGVKVKESLVFKINRDADISVDEQRDEDFIEAMREVIIKRVVSKPTRLIISADESAARIKDLLQKDLAIDNDDIYLVNGPLDLGGLREIACLPGFEQLRRRKINYAKNFDTSSDSSIWEEISRHDIMLHLPYEAFDTVERFYREAAEDEQVIAIKTTLYRTGKNSPVVAALKDAALKGKQVVAIVELLARFDEEQNMSWAKEMQDAGVIVVYGIAHLKVHAKMAMVLRREEQGIKRYVNLSTGNYNTTTAQEYEDIHLFTARNDIAFDAGLVFNMLSGYTKIQKLHQLVMAPFTLKERLLFLIKREKQLSTPDKPGYIFAKLNALADKDVIQALCDASNSGVKIDLCVRGICMLLPGVENMSANIQVKSIVGQYLEHSRIYYFANGGAEEYYLASSDWMPRNLERRVELMFPVLDAGLKDEMKYILSSYLKDNKQSWSLHSDGQWIREAPTKENGESAYNVQDAFKQHYRIDERETWEEGFELKVRLHSNKKTNNYSSEG